MNDLISKSKLIEEILEEASTKILGLESGVTLGEMKEWVENQPIVEAVPVVRCKDCKHSDLPAVLTRKYGKTGTLTCHNRYGSCNNRNVNENDFCSAGELPEQT